MVILKVLKTLRNHWKKSTFAAVLLGYGSNYAKDRYETNQMMRVYCEEASKYGDMPLRVGRKPRHVTVILNPASKDGKGPSLYEKYSEPLLHLAGLKVSMIKTEHEGQAKSIMEIMENTDCVLVAGGDGTVSEAVTGLFRRTDAETVLPIGIVPIGRTNTVARNLFRESENSEARLLAETTMSVIKDVLKPVDVLCIQPQDEGKPTYSLVGLDWGVFRDTESLINKYWYWAGLKQRMAFVFRSVKSWPVELNLDLTYTLPCEGCSRCYQKRYEPVRKADDAETRRWWHSFVPRPKSTIPAIVEKDYSKVENPSCGEKHQLDVTTASQLQIHTANSRPGCESSEKPSVEITLYPTTMSRWNFIKEGWRRQNVQGPDSIVEKRIIQASEISLTPKVEEGTEEKYTIDQESFDVRPVDIKLQPKRLRIYCTSG